MPPHVHPTAIIAPEAQLAADVRVGPFAVVEGPVVVGPGCVIHAHPPGALLCGVAGIELRPIIGSYDGGFTIWNSLRGVPLFPHAYLINRPELAHRLIAFMGEKDVCMMRGHGITVTGRTVEQATIRAVQFEAMCRMALGVPFVREDVHLDWRAMEFEGGIGLLRHAEFSVGQVHQQRNPEMIGVHRD